MTITDKKLAVFFSALLVLVLLSPALYMLVTGDFPGSDRFYGIQEDSEVVDYILTAHHGIVKVAK